MTRPLKIAWRHPEEELYELYRRERWESDPEVAGSVVAKGRGEADLGEGGVGGDGHDDTTVGSVVRGGWDRGSSPAQVG